MKKEVIFMTLFIIISIFFTMNSNVIEIKEKKNLSTLNSNEITFNNGDILGELIINSINLKAPIKDGVDMYTLLSYIGHFKSSSYIDGNICLAGHNSGFNTNYFKNLDKVRIGDEIIYQNEYFIQMYIVTEIKIIDELDVSVLNSTENNQITLITCTTESSTRLCVIGKEVK